MLERLFPDQLENLFDFSLGIINAKSSRPLKSQSKMTWCLYTLAINDSVKLMKFLKLTKQKTIIYIYCDKGSPTFED